MYRRLESSLPPDFEFPANLEGLGYFITDDDNIRMIDDPSEPFNYWCSKNERYVDMQKEAMSQCIRDIVTKRLGNIKVGSLPLPFPHQPGEPYIPISASKNIGDAERIVVYVGEGKQDIGILAGRVIGNESINLGSAVNFCHDILADPSSPDASLELKKRGLQELKTLSKTAVVLANPGQLIWWRRGKKALSYESWHAIPRKYGCGYGPVMTEKNRVPRNENDVAHIQCLFDDFLYPLVQQTGIKIDVIAVSDALESVLTVLDRDWKKWEGSMQAIVTCLSGVYDPQLIHDEDFRAFWGKRARAYITDEQPLGTPMTGRQIMGCNVYSAGVSDYLECVMLRSYREFLDYFKLVAAHPDNYEAIAQDIEGPQMDTDPMTWGADEDGDVNIDVEIDGGDEVGNIEVSEAAQPQGDEHGKIAESA